MDACKCVHKLLSFAKNANTQPYGGTFDDNLKFGSNANNMASERNATYQSGLGIFERALVSFFVAPYSRTHFINLKSREEAGMLYLNMCACLDRYTIKPTLPYDTKCVLACRLCVILPLFGLGYKILHYITSFICRMNN